MNSNRLPRRAYNMLIKLDERDKNTWATEIGLLLYTHGFGFVWENKGVQSIVGFLKVFKQRLVDCNTRNWYGHLTNSQRFEIYKTYKTCFTTEMYLALDLNKHAVNALNRFRMGLSITEAHKNGYKCLSPKKLLCPMCKTTVESDIHFLLVCSAYEDLRAHLIPPKYLRNPCLFRFVSPMITKVQL